MVLTSALPRVSKIVHSEQTIDSQDGDDCEHTEADHENKMEELVEIAKKDGNADVLDSFSKSFLRFYVCLHCGKRSTNEMLKHLKDAVDCREEIHELERNMDKEHFVKLVTGGYFMSGGVDKESRLPIFWFQTGRLDNNAWRYKCGSPRANAFVR